MASDWKIIHGGRNSPAGVDANMPVKAIPGSLETGVAAGRFLLVYLRLVRPPLALVAPVVIAV